MIYFGNINKSNIFSNQLNELILVKRQLRPEDQKTYKDFRVMEFLAPYKNQIVETYDVYTDMKRLYKGLELENNFNKYFLNEFLMKYYMTILSPALRRAIKSFRIIRDLETPKIMICSDEPYYPNSTTVLKSLILPNEDIFYKEITKRIRLYRENIFCLYVTGFCIQSVHPILDKVLKLKKEEFQIYIFTDKNCMFIKDLNTYCTKNRFGFVIDNFIEEEDIDGMLIFMKNQEDTKVFETLRFMPAEDFNLRIYDSSKNKFLGADNSNMIIRRNVNKNKFEWGKDLK